MTIGIQTGGLLSYWGAADTFRMIREAGFDGLGPDGHPAGPLVPLRF